MGQRIKTVVFPVAGLGSRLWPLTASIPKEMLPVYDKPLIHYAVQEAIEAGYEKFIFITSGYKKSLEDYFDTDFLSHQIKDTGKSELISSLKEQLPGLDKVFFVRQGSSKGLGHAIGCAKNLVDEEYFAIVSPDDFIVHDKGCLQQMTELFEKAPGQLLATMEVEPQDVSKYGILAFSKHYKRHSLVHSMIEKPSMQSAPSQDAIIGRYILHRDIFSLIEKQEAGFGDEIQLTDAIAKSLPSQTTYGYRFEGIRFDCGQIDGLADATMFMRNKIK